VTCLIVSSKDNYCQVPKLPKIQIPKTNPLDAINTALANVLTDIESARKKGCSNIEYANATILRLWLYNTDPTLENYKNQAGLDSASLDAIKLMQSVATGIGLVPRELILRQRIKTLEGFVNQAPKTVNLNAMDALKQSKNAPANERVIQAFLSAYYSLGN